MTAEKQAPMIICTSANVMQNTNAGCQEVPVNNDHQTTPLLFKNRRITRVKMQRFIAYSMSFLLGAVLLSLLSMIQKIAVGYDPLFLKGYIMSVLSGGVIGMVIGHYFFKVKKLNNALLERVNNLESYMLICSNCKKIRKPGSEPKDKKSWEAIESYITDRTNSKFSHGICPDCVEKLYKNKT